MSAERLQTSVNNLVCSCSDWGCSRRQLVGHLVTAVRAAALLEAASLVKDGEDNGIGPEVAIMWLKREAGDFDWNGERPVKDQP